MTVLTVIAGQPGLHLTGEAYKNNYCIHPLARANTP